MHYYFREIPENLQAMSPTWEPVHNMKNSDGVINVIDPLTPMHRFPSLGIIVTSRISTYH